MVVFNISLLRELAADVSLISDKYFSKSSLKRYSYK